MPINIISEVTDTDILNLEIVFSLEEVKDNTQYVAFLIINDVKRDVTLLDRSIAFQEGSSSATIKAEYDFSFLPNKKTIKAVASIRETSQAGPKAPHEETKKADAENSGSARSNAPVNVEISDKNFTVFCGMAAFKNSRVIINSSFLYRPGSSFPALTRLGASAEILASGRYKLKSIKKNTVKIMYSSLNGEALEFKTNNISVRKNKINIKQTALAEPEYGSGHGYVISADCEVVKNNEETKILEFVFKGGSCINET